MNDKSSLRKQFINLLKSKTHNEMKLAAEHAVQRFLEKHELKGNLLIYKAMKIEIPLDNELQTLSGNQVRLYYPRCVDGNIRFYLNSKDQFSLDEECIQAPPLDSEQWNGQVGFLLIPALACDLHGYRLGHGGGYYDRFLDQPEVRVLTKILVALEDQVVESLPRDPWDRPAQAILTPERFFKIPI